MADIQVGSKLWSKYSPAVVYVVSGETSRSWIVRYYGQHAFEEGFKLPKSKPLPPEYFLNERDWSDYWFDVNHRDNILRWAGRFATLQQLRQIAELTGWKEPGKEEKNNGN